MTPRARVLGWLGAATTAAALLTGAAALAITALPPPPVMLDLGQTPPAAPVIAAIAEAAPQVVDEAPAMDTPPAPIESMPPPAALDAPVLPTAAPPINLPKPDVFSQSDLALPAQKPPPKPAEQPPAPQKQAKVEKPKKQPDPKPAKSKPKVKPQKPEEETAEVKAQGTPAKPVASAGSSAPQKGQKANGGAAKMSSASYAKAVMKKVLATKKKSGAGKGVAVVGFTVAKNGGLAGVKVIRSSGNAALDQIAVGHIQRSAPFPAPPEGAGQSFSFEFIGK